MQRYKAMHSVYDIGVGAGYWEEAGCHTVSANATMNNLKKGDTHTVVRVILVQFEGIVRVNLGHF